VTMKALNIIGFVTIAWVIACTPDSKVNEVSKQVIKTHYDSNNEVKKYVTIDYDKNNKKIRTSEFHKDGELLWYWDYEYDGELIVKAVVHHGTDEVSVQSNLANTPTGVFYTYDYQDSLISKITQQTDTGNVLSFALREYDEGLLLKETWYTADETPTYYCRYTRDEKGKIIRAEVSDYQDHLLHYEIYEYTNNKLTKVSAFRDGGEDISYAIIKEG